jgi:hypothetical protein
MHSAFVVFPFFPTLKMAIGRIYRRSGSESKLYSSDRAEKQQTAASSTFLVADASDIRICAFTDVLKLTGALRSAKFG